MWFVLFSKYGKGKSIVLFLCRRRPSCLPLRLYHMCSLLVTQDTWLLVLLVTTSMRIHPPPPPATPKQFSVTPSECSTIRLSSDAVYLEIASDSTDSGRLLPACFRCQVTHNSLQFGCSQRLRPFPWVRVFPYNSSQNSRKRTLACQFIKGYDTAYRRTARWRDPVPILLFRGSLQLGGPGVSSQDCCPCKAGLCHPPGVDVFSCLDALQTLYHSCFMDAPSHCSHPLGTSFPAPLLSLRGLGWSCKTNVKLPILACSFCWLASSRSQAGTHQDCLIRIKKAPNALISQEFMRLW